MIAVTLPDGSIREYEQGSSALDVAKSISEGLARNVLAAEANGEVIDATLPLNEDVNLKLLTWNDKDGKSTMWHSSAHLMAEAIEALYPGTKLAIGPSIESGFYYDIDLGGHHITDADLPTIEKKMIELARQKNGYVRQEISKEDAITYFKDKDDEYKLE